MAVMRRLGLDFCAFNRHVSASNAGFHGLRPEAVTFASDVHKWLAQWAEIAIRYPSTFRVPEGFRWRK
jgi:hypothetical protein